MALGQTKHKRKFSPPGLMLTSMMDMFTIILIFLLFSFSEKPETMTMDKALDLPVSSTEQEYDQAAKIVLSRNQLLLNDEVMAVVENNQIVGLDPDNLEQSALFQRLKAYRTEHQNNQPIGEVPNEGVATDPAATNADSKEDVSHVLFLCDKSHSFKTINNVIKTAGLAGFPNFQFAVLERPK